MTFRRTYRRFSKSKLLLIGGLAAYCSWRLFDAETTQLLENGNYIVLRVTDACDLQLICFGNDSNDLFPTRLIGIDFSSMSADKQVAARQRIIDLTSAKNVRVRLDKRRIDRDQLFLAHVYIGDRLLSESLVSEGLAVCQKHDSDNGSISRLLRKAEQQAKLSKTGFWANNR